MLKINHKLEHPLVGGFALVGGYLLFQYLTFVPEYSNAALISTDTPVVITPTTPLAKWDDLQYMQQMTSQACADAKVGDSKVLTDNSAGNDSRKTYTVQKMEIGNECWMTENMDSENGRWYHDSVYGGYYSWDNARNACTQMGDSWVLPAQAQYQSVISSYSSKDALMGSPYKFLPGGYYGGSLSLNGSEGRYWTSLPIDYESAYFLSFNNRGVSVYSHNTKTNRFSVRCITKDTSSVTPVDPSVGTGINDPNVNVAVPAIITLDVSDGVDIVTESGVVNTGEFTATVESNSDYTISLNAVSDELDATSLVSYKDGNKIGEIPTIATSQPQRGISRWGVRICTGPIVETCTTNYQPLPAKNQTNTFVTGIKGINTHLFQIGIGIGPELPSGTYSTSIQVTAAQK